VRCRLPKKGTEFRIDVVGRFEMIRIFHLHNQQEHRPQAFIHAFHQAAQMLSATLGRGIWEADHAVILQCHALDLYEPFFVAVRMEIESGIAVNHLALQDIESWDQAEPMNRFTGRIVRSLAVDINQKSSLSHGYQVVSGLTMFVIGMREDDIASRYQKFAATASVLDMASNLISFH
jgi:hypothetical protein